MSNNDSAFPGSFNIRFSLRLGSNSGWFRVPLALPVPGGSGHRQSQWHPKTGRLPTFEWPCPHSEVQSGVTIDSGIFRIVSGVAVVCTQATAPGRRPRGRSPSTYRGGCGLYPGHGARPTPQGPLSFDLSGWLWSVPRPRRPADAPGAALLRPIGVAVVCTQATAPGRRPRGRALRAASRGLGTDHSHPDRSRNPRNRRDSPSSIDPSNWGTRHGRGHHSSLSD